MTTRPTTLVESDQLAQAAAHVIKHEDFVPKSKRWPFSRPSKAHRDYEKAVQEIATRRREARETAVERKIKKEQSEADALFERAKASAQAAYDEKISEVRGPYDEVEAAARSERDAAIQAANLAYQRTVDEANRIYQEEAAVVDQTRGAVVAEARSQHDQAYAALEAIRKTDLAQIVRDLKVIPLEGPMRIVEDKQTWSPEERKKALIGIVDMVGREDFDPELAELCLQNVASYVFQDRYLKPDAQHHRLMEVNLLEALVDLAQRNPDKRPTIVKYLHEIVVQNPGHSSPTFIKTLTELYVLASADADTVYAAKPQENEAIFESMCSHIADTLKLTPRRNQVAASSGSGGPREPGAMLGDDQKTPLMTRSNADITADVDVRDLLPAEASDSLHSGPE